MIRYSFLLTLFVLIFTENGYVLENIIHFFFLILRNDSDRLSFLENFR